MAVFPEGVIIATTPPVVLGVGGLPRASPHFKWPFDDCIRHPRPICCMDCIKPGPNIPEHWYDGGDGWVTKYFTDVQPFSWVNKSKGTYKCQVAGCNFNVENDEKCVGTPCWLPGSAAVTTMIEHASAAHGQQAPPKRDWSTGLCNRTGCCDVLLCLPCQASRQMMATAGWANKFNVWWCCFFCLAGCQQSQDDKGNNTIKWSPPFQMAAVFTRCAIVRANNIDEHWCKTFCCGVLCSPCSLAQSYREFSAAGVWPGGTCCNGMPPVAQLQPLKMQ